MRQSENAALDRVRSLGGDQLVSQLATLYLAQTSERIAVVRTALANGDAALIAAAAHGIRSGGAQLGALDVVGACELLEASAESGDLRAASADFAHLLDTFFAFRTRLAAMGVRAGSSRDAARVAVSRSQSMTTIAVIEDNADNRLLLDAILGERYTLNEYATGTDALEGMPSHPPALVLLDVSLPGMDGLDVLASIRRDPVLQDVPVVAVTAHAMAGDRERYLAAGFDGYVPKPIVDERALIGTVERLLAARHDAAGRDDRTQDESRA